VRRDIEIVMTNMMNILLKSILVTVIFVSQAFAFEMAEVWNEDYSPELRVTCSNMDSLCLNLCDKEEACTVPQKVCKDCIGTSILMTNIFDRMGLGYRSTGVDVDSSELVEFIRGGNFVTFTSKSIYNQIDTFDNLPLRMRFQGLCPTMVEYPVVFFELKPRTAIIGEVKYVACGSTIFTMTSTPNILDGLKPMRFKFPVF
jgi:hypothetical protein